MSGDLLTGRVWDVKEQMDESQVTEASRTPSHFANNLLSPTAVIKRSSQMSQMSQISRRLQCLRPEDVAASPYDSTHKIAAGIDFRGKIVTRYASISHLRTT